MKPLILYSLVLLQFAAVAAQQAPTRNVKCIVKANSSSRKILAEVAALLPVDAYKSSAQTPSLVLPLTAIYAVEDTVRYNRPVSLTRTLQIVLVLSKSDNRSRIIYGEVSRQLMEERGSEKQIMSLTDDGYFSAIFSHGFPSEKTLVNCQLLPVTP